jgi:hypothetical protein
MIHVIRLAALVALLWAVAATEVLAQDGSAPDSAQRAALQERIGHLGRVRIQGPGGTTLLLEPVVREDGLHMRGPWKAPRPALFVAGALPAAPHPAEFVPWSAIERVEVHRNAARSGALTGAVIGGFVVGLTLLTSRRQVTDSWEQYGSWIMAGSAVLIGGTTLIGLVLGTYGEEWAPVYPPPAPAAGR